MPRLPKNNGTWLVIIVITIAVAVALIALKVRNLDPASRPF
jgi:hypothetical protein